MITHFFLQSRTQALRFKDYMTTISTCSEYLQSMTSASLNHSLLKTQSLQKCLTVSALSLWKCRVCIYAHCKHFSDIANITHVMAFWDLFRTGRTNQMKVSKVKSTLQNAVKSDVLPGWELMASSSHSPKFTNFWPGYIFVCMLKYCNCYNSLFFITKLFQSCSKCCINTNLMNDIRHVWG